MTTESPAFGQKDQPLPLDSALALRDRVIAGIRLTVQELFPRKEPLDPQDIFVPYIRKTPYDVETEEVLRKVGLEDGFSVIFVRDRDSQVIGENEIYVQGFDNLDSRRLGITLELRKLILGRLMYIDLEQRSSARNMFAAKRHDAYGWDEVAIGSTTPSFLRNQATNSPSKEAVLLLIGDKDKVRVSYLALPDDWRRAVRNGKLIEEPKEQPQPEKHIQNLMVPEELKLTTQIKNGQSEAAFAEMRSKVMGFPDYRGIALNKKGQKMASFSDVGTDVEIDLGHRQIVFNFRGLDMDRLRKICQSNKINLQALTQCFRLGPNTDSMMLEVVFHGDRGLRLNGKIIKWDVAENRWIDALPYLGPTVSLDDKQRIANLLNDPVVTLPFFFAKLKTPEDNPLSVVILPKGNTTFRQKRRSR